MIISTGLEKCSRMDGIKGRAPKEKRKRKPLLAISAKASPFQHVWQQ
jgi:hypothetical protein